MSCSPAVLPAEANSDSTQLHGPISGTYSITGPNITLSVTCPMVVTVVSPFTATPTQAQLVNSDDPNEVHTYTLQ